MNVNVKVMREIKSLIRMIAFARSLPYKGRAINVYFQNYWDLEPFYLLNGLALGCYQPTPEV